MRILVLTLYLYGLCSWFSTEPQQAADCYQVAEWTGSEWQYADEWRCLED